MWGGVHVTTPILTQASHSLTMWGGVHVTTPILTQASHSLTMRGGVHVTTPILTRASEVTLSGMHNHFTKHRHLAGCLGEVVTVSVYR